MAGDGDISSVENIVEMLKRKSTEEICVVLAGKTGAGKTTLFQNIVGEEVVITMSPDPSTKEIKKREIEKNGQKLVIYDTPGLIGGDEDKMKKLKEWSQKIKSVDLLACCVPVGPGAKFKDDGYPLIIRCLHEAFGTDIWKQCVVIFTFGNYALDRCHRSAKENGIDSYKDHIESYSTRFQEELTKLNVKDIHIKSVFEWESENGNQYPGPNTILGIPAGDRLDDRVLPGIVEDQTENWRDKVFLYMFSKCKLQRKGDLLEFQYGAEFRRKVLKKLMALLGGSIGGGVGALAGHVVAAGAAKAGANVGAAFGTPAGPVGAVIGAIVGATLGTISGLLVARKIQQNDSTTITEDKKTQ